MVNQHEKISQGIKLTKRGLMKFDVIGRARKNWITDFKKKSRRFLKNKCEKCLETKQLTIHHIDSVTCTNGILQKIKTLEELNYKVLNPNNCMTLCRNCHDKEHNFVKW